MVIHLLLFHLFGNHLKISVAVIFLTFFLLFFSIFLSDFVKFADDSPKLEFEQVPFNHPLFIMYSSGTTGPPKCMVHSVGVSTKYSLPSRSSIIFR